MFENIIGQSVVSQLTMDFKTGRLAPSLLFYGPAASGKGSTALELARILSCQSAAVWNCSCPACIRHRYIMHSDLLCLGKRSFSTEIAAARAAFLREPFAPSTPVFFIRSVRKLLARFSPVLWEDDSRLGKFRTVLEALEEGLAEFEARSEDAADADKNKFDIKTTGKISESVLKNSQKLETDCLGDIIPVAQLRRALYWTRIAPVGKRKTLLIENAESMQEGSRNSLLKILEEPPDAVTIVMCAERRQQLIPTLLSRLRPYRFLKRSREKECEIIHRVFRDSVEPVSGLSAYLDSFRKATNESVYGLSAFFIAGVARSAARELKKRSAGDIPEALNALGMYCAPLADAAGFQKVAGDGEARNIILEKSSGFENMSYSQFISVSRELVSRAMQNAGVKSESVACRDIWRKYTAESDAAVSVYNQNPVLALEALFYRLKTALST